MEVSNPHTLQKAAAHLQKNDPFLSPIIMAAGIASIVPNQQYYRSLVKSIISQQLSVTAAASILKRFLALFPEGQFPTPTMIMAQSIESFRQVGLSRQKASYIIDLAAKVSDGTVQFGHLDGLSNDQIVAELTTIKGVGVWTVHMFLLFCMGRMDILPTGDLGIKNGMQTLYKLDMQPTPADMESIARKYNWHPYESVASWYVWRSLNNKPTTM